MQTKMPPVALKRFFYAGQVENLKSVMDFSFFTVGHFGSQPYFLDVIYTCMSRNVSPAS